MIPSPFIFDLFTLPEPRPPYLTPPPSVVHEILFQPSAGLHEAGIFIPIISHQDMLPQSTNSQRSTKGWFLPLLYCLILLVNTIALGVWFFCHYFNQS